VAGFGNHIIQLMSQLVPGATISFDQINESSGYYSLDHNVPLDLADQAKVHARLQEVYRENPIYGYIQGGGKGPLVDLAELMPRRAFQRTTFYQDIFRPYGIEHQISVMLSREGWINTLTINRDLAIPERMKTLLSLVSRHIQLAHRNACLIDCVAKAVVSTDATRLTVRESEVFCWLQEGKRNSEIGIILGCSPRTIDKHVQNILRKTGAETRTAAVRNKQSG
jgi:DNA-binding CsgD family transcriptional regulator